MRYEADLVAMKPNTDITVLGQAHAPFGRKAESVDVSLRVDEVSKTLRVFGNRTIDRVFSAVVYSSPVPFVTQPIRYEHAFGESTCPIPIHRSRRSTFGIRQAAALRHTASRWSGSPLLTSNIRMAILRRSDPQALDPLPATGHPGWS